MATAEGEFESLLGAILPLLVNQALVYEECICNVPPYSQLARKIMLLKK